MGGHFSSCRRAIQARISFVFKFSLKSDQKCLAAQPWEVEPWSLLTPPLQTQRNLRLWIQDIPIRIRPRTAGKTMLTITVASTNVVKITSPANFSSKTTTPFAPYLGLKDGTISERPALSLLN